jgi:O-antigen/teichoic acid export membrane protein
LVTSLISLKLATHYLSSTEFGLWGVLFQLMGYFYLLELGVISSMGRVFAGPIARKSSDEASRWISTTAFIINAQGVLIFLVGALCGPLLFHFIHVDSSLASEAGQLWWGILFIHLIQTPFKPFIGILHAGNRVFYVNVVGITGQILMVLAFALFLSLGLGTSSYIWSYAITALISSLAYWVAARRTVPIRFLIGLKYFEIKKLKELFSFSIGLFALNLAAQVTTAGQGVLIARFSSLSEAAGFAVTSRLSVQLAMLLQRTVEAFLPKWSLEWAGGRQDEAIKGFRKVYSATLPLLGLLLFWVILVNPAFVVWWTAPEYFSGSATNVGMGLVAVIFTINRIMQLLFLMKMKAGNMAKVTSLGALFEVALYFYLIPKYGTAGVPAASCLANLMWTTPIMMYGALRSFGTVVWKWNFQLLGWLVGAAITAYILRAALPLLGVRVPLQCFVVASLVASSVSFAVILISLRIVRKQNLLAEVKEEIY